jgi:hypothetical protein
VSMEVQFVHRVSDIRSHLLLVFRHWSQAEMGVNDQEKIEAEAKRLTDLGCFSSSSRPHRRQKCRNLSGTSYTGWYRWKRECRMVLGE